MKETRFQTWITALLLGVCTTGQAEPDDRIFEKWPEQWVAVYERFEAFAKAKKMHWPDSHLWIGASGKVEHTLRYEGTGTASTSLVITEFGPAGGGWVLHRNLEMRDDLNSSKFRLAPGTYAAQVKSFSELGFQYHEPLIWFQVTESPEDVSLKGGLRFQNLNVPVSDETRIPNQRLTNFLDFHVFTARRNPNTISQTNQVVDPAVELRIENDGTIHRSKLLNLEWDTLLRWRIYKNNDLIDQGEVLPDQERKIDSGQGSYHVFLVVDGPAGWLPVSNVLNFPLFPADGDTLACIPEGSDRNKIPDRIESIHSKLKQNQNISESERHTLALWHVWKWEIQQGGKFKMILQKDAAGEFERN